MSGLEDLPNPDHFEAVDDMLIRLGIDISECATNPVVASFVAKLFNRVDDEQNGVEMIHESEGDT